MNRGIYATATGMLANQRMLDAVANNLANISTNGFKRDGFAFTDAFVREMRAKGGQGEYLGTLGTGAKPVGEYSSAEQGPIAATGNPLDIAIESEKGAFAVQTPQGVRYTRDGSFRINGEGLLAHRQGHPVLDASGNTISVPQNGGTAVLDAQGNVLVGGQSVGQIGVFDGAFMKAGDNLYTGQAQPMTEVRLTPGALEGSNVNAVESMIEMITLNRQFEMAQRSITQQDELTQRLIQSLQDR